VKCLPLFRLLAVALVLDTLAINSSAANEQPLHAELFPSGFQDFSFADVEDNGPSQSVLSEVPDLAPDRKANCVRKASPSRKPNAEQNEKFTHLIEDATKIDGMIPLYRQGERLLAALRPDDFDSDLIILITIARGIGQRPLVGGTSWDFGDDWVCQFRLAGERVHFVRRNVRYRADEGSPSAEAVRLAYTDSVLFSLPIAARGPDGEMLVDLAQIFMSDLPQISNELEGFKFSAARSTWAKVRSFRDNLELQVAATYSSDGTAEIESVPDTRAVGIHVHYSISRLPQSNYQPRLADDRVGYFVSAMKDFSQPAGDDNFVRYINRWHLEKADPQLELSPPREPIVFWLEKTIPYRYRRPIREGILEWNKAFEQIGFHGAIEVRQQADDARWEPGDVRYNTFRWITAGTGVAIGPSRVNPTTGQILDADILFDADILQVWRQKHEAFSPEAIAQLTGGPLDLATYRLQCACSAGRQGAGGRNRCQCGLMHGMSHELAFAATVLARRGQTEADLQKLIMQGIKKVAMHETGHALGLRHNFKGSSLYSLDEAHDISLAGQPSVLSSSVMDYLPPLLASRGKQQGDYYSTTIGPYDRWAIDYGYRSLPGNSPQAELVELQKIASQSGLPDHAFASDEDTRGIDSDPHSGLFDFGDDMLKYAQTQAELVAESWPDLVERMTNDGQGYQQARQAFGVLLATHGRAMFAAARYVGGAYTSRSHKGDQGETVPFAVVEPQRQRQAVELLARQMFSDAPFQFPPELYNQLTVSYWDHWGTTMSQRTDFPVHEAIRLWQDRVLEKLLSPLTLSRLHDSELKTPSDQDAFTVAELIERLTDAVFAELDAPPSGTFTTRQPAISSLRRNLQRAYLRRLSQLSQGQADAPSDSQTIAYAELAALEVRISELLRGETAWDAYSRAHLVETAARIGKVLNTQYVQAQ